MKPRWRNLLFFAGMFLLAVLLMDFSRRLEQLDRLNRQLEVMQRQATAVMSTQVALLTQVAYASSDEAVEEWVYREGKWVRGGEKLVQVLPAHPATPTPYAVTEISTPVPKWRIWWELFFGKQP
ncbi:MAG: hypothetical protein N2049_10360 [Anaerolineales bacterium]|nr:hypothetical protein [Anaerolineales bacterium]MCX7609604.1 hypothetical protein [Anaerolineales bacterium]MDW8226260.1 hypothetical protein [Anaerolineales bacterium]